MQTTTVYAYHKPKGRGEDPDSFGPFQSRDRAESTVAAIADQYRRIEIVTEDDDDSHR